MSGYSGSHDHSGPLVCGRGREAEEKGEKPKTAPKVDKETAKAMKELQENLQKFIGRLPVFMYINDEREKTVLEVIETTDDALFYKATGITKGDFRKLLELGVFDDAYLNDALQEIAILGLAMLRGGVPVPLGLASFETKWVGEIREIHPEMRDELHQIFASDLPFRGLDLRYGRSVTDPQRARDVLMALPLLFPNGLQALSDEVQSHLRLPFLIKSILPRKKRKNSMKGDGP